eukprot:TRINITY_DN8087_c0_g1_i1.p1 TRINITY_DN8087_c0_g1~~TRINITY_DN8087_c0_g1_i1.p1  ORF type:complete len:356 (-),score=68.36 TRINITY_DN8087_c0_g1_i1:51-1094(-)
MDGLESSSCTVYFLLSSDPSYAIRRRSISTSVLRDITSFKNYIVKEFQLAILYGIGIFDQTANDYILLERNEDLMGTSKFKIFTSINIPIGNSLSITKERSPQENALRVQLAAAYRLFDIYGWTDLIYNHLTVAIKETETEKHFLINPFGLLFSEITASSLVTIDLEGNIADPGTTQFGINPAGYVIHSAIHNGRKDVKCIMHCHSNAGTAVSCMKDGLMSISQNAAILGPVAYHDYEGLAVNLDERKRLVDDLGPVKKVMILRNHGILSCGSTIAEAFFNMFMLNKCCEIQIAALSAGKENLTFPPNDTQEFTQNAAANVNPEGIGEKEFKALLRKLDRIDPSYRM